MAEPTYIFKDDNVYTVVEGKVVAKVKESDFEGQPGGHQIADPQVMPEVPHELQDDLSDAIPCPACGAQTSPGDQFCPQCGQPIVPDQGGMGQEEQGVPGADLYGQEPPPHAQAIANTIMTPNGLKGKILGRIAGLWGDEVTVRFENGVIKRLPVSAVTFAHEASTEEPVGKVAGLDSRLAAAYQGDRDSLVARLSELEAIKKGASRWVGSASNDEAQELDRIVTQAEYERLEVEAALAHISAEDTEAFEPPAPIENMPMADQASHGGSSTWLDQVVSAMVVEAENTDYEKLMDEGPESFVAGLEDTQIGESGATREAAVRFIRSLTAGADESLREKYEKVWLARVEQQRKARLSTRKEEVQKEASVEAPDAPDESLFL
jgi:hypothetical protein